MDANENDHDHDNDEMVPLPAPVLASLSEECALYSWHMGREVSLSKFLGIVVGIMRRHYRDLWDGQE